jgi:ATP/maltotriose-dependent transcriptional regulator MalT
MERDPAERARLLLGRARAHRVAGLVDAVFADLEEALRVAAPEDRFDILHARAAVLGMRGQLAEAEAAFRALAHEASGTPAEAKALGHLALCTYLRGDVTGACVLGHRALETCEDDGYRAYLLPNLGWFFWLAGRWDEAERLLAEGLACAQAAGDIHDECSVVSIASRIAAWRGDGARAFDLARRAVRLAARLGNPADRISTTDALCTAFLESDMPSEAVAAFAEVADLDVPGIEPRELAYAYVVLGEAHVAAGDLPGARAAAARAEAHLQSALLWRPAVDLLRAHIDLVAGDVFGALARLDALRKAAWPAVHERGRCLEILAEALWAAGERRRAMAAAEEARAVYLKLGARRRAARAGEWLAARARRPGRPRSTLPGRLTEREVEILGLIVLGRSNRDIARELTISIGTAKKHVENVMAKAGASRRTELVPFALSLGLLTPEVVEGAAARARGERYVSAEEFHTNFSGSSRPRPGGTIPPLGRSTPHARG